jgi:hypothetical protein
MLQREGIIGRMLRVDWMVQKVRAGYAGSNIKEMPFGIPTDCTFHNARNVQ